MKDTTKPAGLRRTVEARKQLVARRAKALRHSQQLNCWSVRKNLTKKAGWDVLCNGISVAHDRDEGVALGIMRRRAEEDPYAE